jgi:hypothetical protein
LGFHPAPARIPVGQREVTAFCRVVDALVLGAGARVGCTGDLLFARP